MTPPPANSTPAQAESEDFQWYRAAPSLPEVFRSIAVPAVAGRFWRKMGAFAGPGYLIAVGYVDPGNWATDLAGGAKYGYALLSVIVLSNFLAIFLQTLSLRLGIASGRDLAQLCRDRFSLPIAVGLWISCELAIIACDLAEVIGAAIALELLFGMPLILGVLLTALDVFLVLWLQGRGFRYVEALVITLLCIIGGCFAVELTMAQPQLREIAASVLPSRRIITNPGMLYLAIGILGATVMPHNLYLHSSIVQSRGFAPTERGKGEAIRFCTIDTVTALIAAMLINAAILILAATINRAGYTEMSEIQDAYRLLTPLLGGLASLLFGVALLVSGQMSALTGTLAGQIIMEGFLRWRVSPVMRRLATRALALLPAVGIIAVFGEGATGPLLVLSQVVLSLQLSFAVVPLIMFTSDSKLMGKFVNPRWMQAVGSSVAVGVTVINGWLVWQVIF
jgi:manganese transport protein